MKFSELREIMVGQFGTDAYISQRDEALLWSIINDTSPLVEDGGIAGISPEDRRAIGDIVKGPFGGDIVGAMNFLLDHGDKAPLANMELEAVAHDNGPNNPIAKIFAELYVQASRDPGGRFNSLERLGSIGDGVVGVTREAFVNGAKDQARTNLGSFIIGRLAERLFNRLDASGVPDGFWGPPFLNALLEGGFQEGSMSTGASLIAQLTADGGNWKPNLSSGAQWSSSLERDPTVQPSSTGPSAPTVV